jgi:hypothetical protein
MRTPALVEQLMSARQQLDLASNLLAKPSPEALESCSSVLEAAGRQLAEWQPTLFDQAGDAAALEEAWRLRRSFVRTARLLQGVGDFHRNWLQLRGAITGGYTETGESAPITHAKRICLHG